MNKTHIIILALCSLGAFGFGVFFSQMTRDEKPHNGTPYDEADEFDANEYDMEGEEKENEEAREETEEMGGDDMTLKGLDDAINKYDRTEWRGHEFIDLGLPSGTLWATNIIKGNNSDYFAWAELTDKEEYGETKWSNASYDELKDANVIDPYSNLTEEYDIARQKWGFGWRLPTKDEIIELTKQSSEWTSLNNKNGRLITGSNGNKLFLPTSGFASGTETYEVEDAGYYWSSSMATQYECGEPDQSYALFFDKDSIKHYTTARRGGIFAIPVLAVKKHHYVDLGLPSGTLWATNNVEDADRYAWGEYYGKERYNGESSAWYNASLSELREQGVIDENMNLTSQHDAATLLWNNRWRMPTREEFKELIDHCTGEWVRMNGQNGQLLHGPNGNTLFLPAKGFIRGTCYDGLNGYYWSATALEEGKAKNKKSYMVEISEKGLSEDTKTRWPGYSIRAVYTKKRDEIR